MKIKILKQSFTVCKIRDVSDVDFSDEFCFLGKTDEEISLVCKSEKTPDNTIERENGWKAFRIEGVLDFSLIGILSKISKILADNKVGIFAVSTYNTDYLFVKERDLNKSIMALENYGYKII